MIDDAPYHLSPTEILESFGLLSIPVDIHALAVALGLVLVYTFDIPEKLPGYLYRGTVATSIILNLRDPGTRNRFTMAHEIRHYLYRDPGVIVLGAVPSRRAGDPAIERAANLFAGEILMPDQFMTQRNRDRMTFKSWCQKFDVSRMAMARRMADLDLS